MSAPPNWLPRKYHDHWRRPWTTKARRSRRFRRLLARRHLFTPNFTYEEMRCKDAARTPVPKVYRSRMRNHCFRLERFRHAVGGAPMPVMSGYRTKRYNKEIHGAAGSQHPKATATDFSRQTVENVGRERWRAAAERIFRNNGVGEYPSGSVHLDSRSVRARWSSFVGS